jgi:hypothetical protein
LKKYSKKGWEKRKKDREGYVEFYTEQCNIARGNKCENCGRRLRGDSSEIAHILPKNVFKSVSTNPNNVLYLCSNKIYNTDGCHDKYDSTWTAVKSMPVWETAIERFKLFETYIEESNFKILNHFYDG